MTKKNVAEYLGVSTAVVTRLTNAGELRANADGARATYLASDVEAYLESANLAPAPSDHPRDTDILPDNGSPIALSFFTGAGGLDLGLIDAGITPVFHAENNRYARMTIEKNFPGAALAGDVSGLTASGVRDAARIGDRDVDVMAGGPPCQAFSTAGAMRGFGDPRGNIFLAYIDLASNIRPKFLVIENVRGLLSAHFPVKEGGKPVAGGALAAALTAIEEMGYSASFNLYNAANFGVPQSRERVILIAARDGSAPAWLEPTHDEKARFGLDTWRTLADALQSVPDGTQHTFVQYPEKRLKFFRKLTEGQNWRDIPQDEQLEAMGKALYGSGGRSAFYRRPSTKLPSPTLVTSPTMPATDLCHPTELRPFSVEEYRAIQQFPSDFWIAGPVQEQYRQIGNAVPVGLGAAVGRLIIREMSGQGSTVPDGFAFSRYKAGSNETWRDPRVG